MNREGRGLPVAEGRKIPWAWQDKRCLRFLRQHFKGQYLCTAIAVYTVLTEVASNANDPDEFIAGRKELATMIGVSLDTLDRYAKRFIEIGLLEVIKRTQEGVQLPNQWRLLSFPDAAPPDRTEAAIRTCAAGRGTEAAHSIRIEERDLEEDDLRSDQPPDRIWSRTLERLQASLTTLVYRQLEGTEGSKWEGKTLVVRCGDYSQADHLTKRLAGHVKRALSEVAGRPVGVRFVV